MFIENVFKGTILSSSKKNFYFFSGVHQPFLWKSRNSGFAVKINKRVKMTYNLNL